ncbi:DUF1684 domain-containing protein [Flavobacterium silvaticum]|uniref:DUF1684 domain-containing protein n=1 Tax=Flavobacterium silvaticum TaxID=1852020 RepID=A0A972JID7_9FLAO|nr:DUF1684 domain-containing protein [Flavobacterium silvaticum]NMH28905.1 DUF1684 domain-containing protein [Flavobacterium silvaticum]
MKPVKVVVVIFLLLTSVVQSQAFDAAKSKAAQDKLDSEYANPAESPLEEKDLKTFHGLDFFPVSGDYYIIAKFKRTESESPFEMKTSTKRRPMYVKYGEVEFSIDGKTCKLNVYRNIELSKKEEYKDHLFLPFRDDTNGEETYAGGRYIDLKIPSGNTMVIDFNEAYNPYCAYNHKYSCPIVPSENILEVAIRAGVKKFHD